MTRISLDGLSSIPLPKVMTLVGTLLIVTKVDSILKLNFGTVKSSLSVVYIFDVSHFRNISVNSHATYPNLDFDCIQNLVRAKQGHLANFPNTI